MIPYTFILIGRSGCGKGTQAKLLETYLKEQHKEFPVFYLETGKRFRDFIGQDSYSSSLARRITEAGELQPAFLAIWMWSNIFIENLTGKEHLIIDGTPRKEREAHVLDDALHFYKREHPYFIYINTNEEWARKRLDERKRNDDLNEEAIDKKMLWFNTNVLPAIEFFRKRDGYHFLEINGEQPIEKVNEDIIGKISNS